MPVDPDHVTGGWRAHAPMVQRDQVSPHRQDLVTRRLDGVTRSGAVALAALARNLYPMLRGGGRQASALGIEFRRGIYGKSPKAGYGSSAADSARGTSRIPRSCGRSQGNAYLGPPRQRQDLAVAGLGGWAGSVVPAGSRTG